MTMTETDRTDKMLDQMFAAARNAEPSPDPGLERRILADAARVQAGFAAPLPAATPDGAGPAGLWGQLSGALGGWMGMGGLAAACAAGVWIGFAPPQMLPDPVAMIEAQVEQPTLDLFGGGDLQLALGEEG